MSRRASIEMKNPARILVVDDTPATLYVTTRVLRAAGFDVVQATTGEEALTLADDSIDVVLLDVQLPDIHGFEVCRRLRERGGTALVPVIHLSATFRADSDRAHGLEAGADSYLTHPVEPVVLIASVNSLLRARRAEEEQRRSEERFRGFFHAAPVGIALLEESGAVAEANPAMCEMLLAPCDGLVGRRFADLFLEEERSSLEGALEASTAVSGLRSFALKRSDGSVAVVELKFEPLPQSTMRLALATDITQRRRYETERERLLTSERAARAEAERVNHLKDQFIAVLGHELRNPLAAIVSGVEALQQGVGAESAERRDWLQDGIARQASRLKSLVNDLLDTTRLSHGKLALKKETVSLAEVAGRAVDSNAELIEKRGHTLTVSIEPRDLAVEVDPLRIEQVVVNLLSNAAKYTPEGGRIWLEAKQQANGTAELAVIDTGAGLEADETTSIFEAFAQAGEQGQGLGIGLTLVRQLVELHGGAVRAESEGAGKGSTFRVSLPLATGVHERKVESERGLLSVTVRTLIVDDNEAAAVMLETLLRKQGYTTAVAHSGEAAIRVAQTFDPELVLLDIGLPDISGYEVAERLRAGGVKAIIAALSGYGREQAKASERGDNFDAHLVKPASFEEIQELAVAVAAKRE